jgi:HPt (histidine-containing phosphotransfer) domain-containing protein
MLIEYLPKEKVNQSLKESTEQPQTKQLNIAMGLEYSNGEEDMFRSVLEIFCNVKDEKKEKLQTAFERGDWKNYTVFIHGLKSTALSIGGEQIGNIAKQLEMAGTTLRNNKSSESEKLEAETFIKSHHAEAMELYDKLVEEAQNYLCNAKDS